MRSEDPPPVDPVKEVPTEVPRKDTRFKGVSWRFLVKGLYDVGRFLVNTYLISQFYLYIYNL